MPVSTDPPCDPLSSGLLFRARPRRLSSTSTTLPPFPCPVSPARPCTPPASASASPARELDLSSLPASSLKELVDTNPQPLAVRAAAAALRAAQMEIQPAAVSASALRAAHAVYQTSCPPLTRPAPAPHHPAQTEVRRLFVEEEEEEEEEHHHDHPIAPGQPDPFEIAAEDVDIEYAHAALADRQIAHHHLANGRLHQEDPDPPYDQPHTHRERHPDPDPHQPDLLAAYHHAYPQEQPEPAIHSIQRHRPIHRDALRQRQQSLVPDHPLQLTQTPPRNPRRRPLLHGVPLAVAPPMSSSRSAPRDEQLDREGAALRNQPPVHEERLALTPRRSPRRRSLLRAMPPASTRPLSSPQSAVLDEQVDPDGAGLRNESVVHKEGLALTPRRSPRRRSLQYAVPPASTRPLSSPQSAVLDEQVDGEGAAIRDEPVAPEDALVLTPRRRARRQAFSNREPPATTWPVSSVRSAERAVVVKEEPREVSGSASAPAKTKPKKRPRSALLEVLRLQKSLETAQWTNSRAVRRQTEVIIISDDEAPSAKAKAVLLKRKAVRQSGGKAGVRVREERMEKTEKRTSRSSAKKDVVRARSTTRQYESAKVDCSGQAEESGPTSDDERPGGFAENQSKGKLTERRKVNLSTKRGQRKEPEAVGAKDVKPQKKAKQKSDKSEKQAVRNAAGQKRKSSSGPIINKRARLAESDDSIQRQVEAVTLNSDANRRASPRHVKVPNEAVTVAIAKSKSAPKASKSSKGPSIVKPVHNFSRESRSASSRGKNGTIDKRTATEIRPKTPVGMVSPTRKSVGRLSASPRDMAKAKRHMSKKQASVDVEEPVKRRRKSQPRKHTESSLDLLAESMEDLRRLDGDSEMAAQGKPGVPKRRQNSALKDSRARYNSVSGEHGTKAKMNDLQKRVFPGPPSSTKRVRSRMARVHQGVINVAPSMTESDMIVVGTNRWDVDGDSIYAVAEPPPKRRGKEQRRIQPSQVEMNDMKSPDKTSEETRKWGTPENLRANYRKAVVVKAPELRLDAHKEKDVGTSCRKAEIETDVTPTQGTEKELDSDSDIVGSANRMDLDMIVHGWVLECKARRTGLDGLGPQEMDEVLRGPFGLGEGVDQIVPEMRNGSVSGAPDRQHGRAEIAAGSRGMHSDAERTYSSGLSDEDINRGEGSASAYLHE